MSRAAEAPVVGRLNRRPARPRTIAGRTGLYVLLVIVALIFLVPLLWLLSLALKSEGELSTPAWLPKTLQWSNFRDAVTMIPFGKYVTVSVFLAIVQSGLATLSSALTGFGFARLRAKGKRALFLVVVATLMLPQIVTVIPTYLIFARVHLVYTYWPWVLWGLAGSAFLIFLFRQTFASIPMDLEDAAIVDGCGYFRIFWRIFLPMAKAVLIAGFVLSFTAAWGDFIAPSLFLDSDHTTLAVGLSGGYTTAAGTPVYTALAAGSLLYVLPVLILFIIAQRGFINGFVTSGLK